MSFGANFTTKKRERLVALPQHPAGHSRAAITNSEYPLVDDREESDAGTRDTLWRAYARAAPV